MRNFFTPIVCLTLLALCFQAPMSAQIGRPNQSSVGGSAGTTERIDQTEWLHIMRANQLMETLQYEEALLELDNAIALNPISAEALAKRAELKMKLGMIAEAERDLALANRQNPYAAQLHGYYGQDGIRQILAYEPQHYMLGINQEVRMQAYRKYLGMQEGVDSLVISQEDSLAAVVLDLIFEENYKEAMQGVDSLKEWSDSLAIVYDLQGLILTQLEDWEAARTSFSKAVALAPDFAIAWYNFAKLEQLSGDWEQAKRYLDKAIDLEKGLTKAYFERALVLKQMGKGEEALKDYDTLASMEGQRLDEVFANRGLTKKMLGDYTGALRDLDAAIEMSPESPQLLKNRGNIQLIFGFPLEAIEDYNRSLELSPNFAEARFNRAMAYLIIFDKEAACDDLEESAELGYAKAEEMMRYFCGY